jgi:hypothetical protein
MAATKDDVQRQSGTCYQKDGAKPNETLLPGEILPHAQGKNTREHEVGKQSKACGTIEHPGKLVLHASGNPAGDRRHLRRIG